LIALPAKERASESARVPVAAESAPSAAAEAPVFEVVDGWWRLPRYGVRMRLPECWEPKEVYKRPFAYREMGAVLQGSINVLSLPNFFYPDLECVAEENRALLGTSDMLELVSMEERTLGDGKRALLIHYSGHPAEQELRFAAVVFLLGPNQIVITASARLELWDDVGPEILASLDSIELLSSPEN